MAKKKRLYREKKFKFPDSLECPNLTIPCQRWRQQICGVVCAARQLQQTSDCRNQKTCPYKDEKNAIKIVAEFYRSRKEAGKSINSLYRLIPRCYLKYQPVLFEELKDIINLTRYEEEKSNPLSKVRI